MEIFTEIKGLRYQPLLCRELKRFEWDFLSEAIKKNGSFLLSLKETNHIALSWWVSPKRTRSYPYARVYDTLGFSGKKVTIIPILKDEGKEGDRDFLQWDTISLMSLLGVYVITGYYNSAERSKRYKNKITNQQFDFHHIYQTLNELLSYQSDALHWNVSQIDKIKSIGNKALDAYEHISKVNNVELHSREKAEERLSFLLSNKDNFMKYSRILAEKAQKREIKTIQPKEHLLGQKASITIQNYLGGYYYFSVDEIEVSANEVFLIESKHSKTQSLPSLEDIKDGLLKMILFTNLEKLVIENQTYKPTAVLKLTIENGFIPKNLSPTKQNILEKLYQEANINGFKLVIQ